MRELSDENRDLFERYGVLVDIAEWKPKAEYDKQAEQLTAWEVDPQGTHVLCTEKGESRYVSSRAMLGMLLLASTGHLPEPAVSAMWTAVLGVCLDVGHDGGRVACSRHDPRSEIQQLPLGCGQLVINCRLRRRQSRYAKSPCCRPLL